ncbi:MAG: 2Fe-2S iron-sulfur cluster-binding protein [Pseudomonadota bacterium]
MASITYVHRDGTRTVADVPNGYTVMEGAVDNGVEGLPAECSGACACATCHAYIDPEWTDRLPAMDDMEDSMLELASDRQDTSRLTCQIEVSDALDGLIVHIADNGE